MVRGAHKSLAHLEGDIGRQGHLFLQQQLREPGAGDVRIAKPLNIFSRIAAFDTLRRARAGGGGGALAEAAG